MPLHEDSPELSDFRQMPYTPTLSKKRGTRGVPEASASLTERFLAKFKIRVENAVKIVEEHWDECVPKRFAGKSAPQNVRLGVLYASVCNPSVRQEMMFCEREILQKVRRLDGCKKIKKIRFV